MRRLCSILAAGLLAGALPAPAQSVFAVRDSGEAPDRTYDVLHYRIEVSFQEARRTVTGRVTTTLVPFVPRLDSVEFDAEKLDVRRVMLATGRTLRFDVRPKKLVVRLDRAYSFRDTITLTTDYSCVPKKGLYFTQPDSGYPRKPAQIWTQGEDMDNHFWFPCYDFPNDKATSELIGTVPADYVLLSNGRLVSVKENAAQHTKTFHWRQEKPHASYLIMLAAGRYHVLHDHAGSLPVDYYVYPEHLEDARACFAETPAMIRFFSERIGFPYPWEKYAQVLIADFVEGGMENTSATALMDNIAVLSPRARVDESPSSLIAHELAHQWWGDVVTCRDWRHLWLNESFASYFDPLYHEATRGPDEFAYTMESCQQAGISTDKTLGRKPIVSVGSYGANVYPRGAAVLHMLRTLLGDTLFWRALHHYITAYQFQSVETNDLKRAIEESTGRNLAWFFDQWVYRAGHPVFDVSYRWNDTARTLSMRVRQTQKIDSLTGIFRVPLEIQVDDAAGGSSVTPVEIATAETTLVLPAPARPVMVLFDRGNTLIKELKIARSRDEWMYQAEHARSPVDRIHALQELAEMADTITTTRLLQRLALHDPFWAVRSEAVDALGRAAAATDSLAQEARPALIAATRDARSAVRNAAVSRLSKCRGPEVVAAVRSALNDSSYHVMAGALRALARCDSAEARATLMRYLNYPSPNNEVGNAALTSLVVVDSVLAVDSALTKVRYGIHPWTRYTALWLITHYGRTRPETLPLLTGLLGDKSPLIRATAIRLLGDVGNETTVALLQQVAADRDDKDAQTAARSIEVIRTRARKEGSAGGK